MSDPTIWIDSAEIGPVDLSGITIITYSDGNRKPIKVARDVAREHFTKGLKALDKFEHPVRGLVLKFKRPG